MTVREAKECMPSALSNTYLREIRDEAFLSASEERTLATAIAGGDHAARSRMIRANLRLVVAIARGFRGRGLILDDLIAEGNLGLIRATKEFDPQFGTRFSTYASYWIKEAIRHALINTTPTIRLPVHVVGLLNKWRRASESLKEEFGSASTPGQIAASLRITGSQVRLIDKAQHTQRLGQKGGVLEEAGSWRSDEPEYEGDAADAGLAAEDEREDLERRLGRLDALDRDVIGLRFGLDGAVPLTLEEVGRRLGLTRERATQIMAGAILKLSDGGAPGAPTGPGLAVDGRSAPRGRSAAGRTRLRTRACCPA